MRGAGNSPDAHEFLHNETLSQRWLRPQAMAEATDASPLVQAYYEAYADRPYMAEFKAEAEMAEAMAEAAA